jgi:hypothetical protein
MPRKIFTAPAPALESLAEMIRENDHPAVLGGIDPENEDGVIIWIEVDSPGEAAEYIETAAQEWQHYEN